jgi:exodeoxyribonuclease-3
LPPGTSIRSVCGSASSPLLGEWKPDVLCLQETKCPQGQFPAGPIREGAGLRAYRRVWPEGLSRGRHRLAPPVHGHQVDECLSASKEDCRHVISVTLDTGPRPIVHPQSLRASGRRRAGPEDQRKICPQAAVHRRTRGLVRQSDCVPQGHEGIVVGDLNIAPLLEHDVWSHKDLAEDRQPHASRDRRHCSAIQKAGQMDMTSCASTCRPTRSFIPGGATAPRTGLAANKGRRLDHIWTTAGLAAEVPRIDVLRY